MEVKAGNKYPDSKAGVKEYIGDFDLKKTYNLTDNLEIIPDPSLKNVWMVIDHGKKFGLIVNLMEDAEGGVPEVDYDQALPYSERKKEGAIISLRKLSSALKKSFDATAIAREIANHVDAAVGQVAYDNWETFQDMGKCWDEETTAHIKRLQREGVRDIPGRLADDLYNDADTLQDLMGDQIHDKGQTDEERKQIVEALKKMRSFAAWQEALSELEKSFS